MKKKTETLLYTIFSFVMVTIHSLLMGRIGIYVDEAGLSPRDVLGSDFWNFMDWLLLLLLFLNFCYSVYKYEKILRNKNT